jgi:hypothetical protein
MLHMQTETRQVRQDTSTLVGISSNQHAHVLKLQYSAKCAKKGVACLGYRRSFSMHQQNLQNS